MLYLAKNLEVAPFILLSMDWRLEHSQGCVSTARYSVHVGLISAKFDQGLLPPPSPLCLLSVHLTSHMIRPLQINFLFPVHRPHLRVIRTASNNIFGGGLVERDKLRPLLLLPLTTFELGDNGMSLREFYHHISTCRNVYCKLLCECSTSLKL